MPSTSAASPQPRVLVAGATNPSSCDEVVRRLTAQGMAVDVVDPRDPQACRSLDPEAYTLCLATDPEMARGLSQALMRSPRACPPVLICVDAVPERCDPAGELERGSGFSQDLIDAVPVPIFYKDLRGRYLGCNKAFLRLVSLPREAVIGASLDELGDTFIKKHALHRSKDEELLRLGGVQVYEDEITTPGGHVLRSVIHKALIPDEAGEPGGIVGVIQDITSQKQVETALRESRETLTRLLEAIEAAIFVVDPVTLTVVDVNPIAERLLGMDRMRVVGSPWDRLGWVEPGSAAGRSCPMGARPLPEGEMLLRNAQGRLTPVSRTQLNLPRQGRPMLYEIVFDRSTQKDLERRVQLSQKLEAVGQLAAGLAHEINTPIQYIADNLSFLRGAFETYALARSYCESTCGSSEQLNRLRDEHDLEFLDEEIPRALEQAVTGAERVGSIIRAMRAFSHPGSQERKITDVNQAVSNAIMICKHEWKFVADVHTDLDPGVTAVSLYPGDFSQVLVNLLVNAAQAIAEKVGDSEDKGCITVITRNLGHAMEVRVEDSGVGIPEANRGLIFDPFFTTKEPGQGTGQGLAIVYELVVRKLGGAVACESQEGRGSAFILHLPLGSDQALLGDQRTTAPATPDNDQTKGADA